MLRGCVGWEGEVIEVDSCVSGNRSGLVEGEVNEMKMVFGGSVMVRYMGEKGFECADRDSNPGRNRGRVA